MVRSTASKKTVYIDLFAGCGGLSLGLHRAGWEGLFAVEKDKMAFSTLKHNLLDLRKHFDWPKWLPVNQHNILTVLKKHKLHLQELSGEVDLVAGGPPCQGFSMAGLRRETDARNRLVYSYLKFIRLVRPKFVLFENVKGFTLPFKAKGAKTTRFSDRVMNDLKDLGYTDIKGQLVNLHEFGVPQRRHRFIIVGSLNGTASAFFKTLNEGASEFLSKKGFSRSNSVSDAISDLLESHGSSTSTESSIFNVGKYGEAGTSYQKALRDNHNEVLSGPDSHRFANHRPSTVKAFRSLLRTASRNVSLAGETLSKHGIKKRSMTVLDGGAASPTITTIPDDYLHYSEPRIMTVRECARLQSFPDSYIFKGNYTTGGHLRSIQAPRYTQVGNAIPPLFAEFAGTILRELRINAKD